jgi:uncharacterized GH25 family protein
MILVKTSLCCHALRGLVLGVWTAAAIVVAHDAWLQPERLTAAPGAILSFDLKRGAEFARTDELLKLEQVKRAVLRLGADVTPVTDMAEADHALRIFATLPRAGVAAVGVELKPEKIVLPADRIDAHLRAMHASEELRTAFAQAAEPPSWRERRVAHVKAFARVGEPPAADRAWSEPVGLALEIVPERDPTLLKADDEFEVRVLKNGARRLPVSRWRFWRRERCANTW